jgi:hypothetical protein
VKEECSPESPVEHVVNRPVDDVFAFNVHHARFLPLSMTFVPFHYCSVRTFAGLRRAAAQNR